MMMAALQLASMLAFVLTANTASSSPQSTDLAPVESETPILIQTMDGIMYAMQPSTGQVLWSINSGFVVDGTSQMDTADRSQPSFIPDLTTGELFVVFPQERSLRKLTSTLPELASGHPLVSDDGFVFHGNKRSSLAALDASTGQLVNHYAKTDDNLRMETLHGLGPQVVLMGRTEYQLVIHEAATNRLLFNMTMAAYSRLNSNFEPSDVQPDNPLPDHALVAKENRLALRKGSKAVWRTEFPGRVVNVFSLDTKGQLVKMNLVRLPEDGSTKGRLAANSYQIRETLGRLLHVTPLSTEGVPLLELNDNDDSDLTSVGSSSDFELQPYISAAALCDADGQDVHCNAETALVVVSKDLYAPVDIESDVPPSGNLFTLVLPIVSIVTPLLLGLLFLFRPSPAQLMSSPAIVPPPLTSDTQVTRAQFPKRFNKLEMYETVLGHGSHGTVVYKGCFEKQPVAIKRMLKEYVDIALREVELLRNGDRHPNVIRYYCLEQDSEFMYIALELCIATLAEVIEGPKVTTRGTHHGALADPSKLASMDKHVIARSILSGVQYLHNLNIVHRDIKPQNVLVTSMYTVVISDLGLGRHVDTLPNSTTSTGTLGWVAPEVLTMASTASFASDVFSIGCVIHYVCSGCHPFGQYFERDSNIRNNQLQLAAISDNCLQDLIVRLLQHNPAKRLPISQALNHPWFWTGKKTLDFLLHVSDRLEKEAKTHRYVTALEAGSARLFGNDWRSPLSNQLLSDLQRFRKYDWTSVIDLLRAIRNKVISGEACTGHVEIVACGLIWSGGRADVRWELWLISVCRNITFKSWMLNSRPNLVQRPTRI
eukprot:m.125461 g.125461  ORF g.125461 m.125461 type:complete len:825 (-) comp15741_c0_seq2:311-2785(-)